MALKMESKQNGLIVVGVCARKDPRLSPFVRHITDIMNERHGVMAAPLNGLVGKKDDCCPNVVRQEIRKVKVDAIVSLGTGKELRVCHNGHHEQAVFAAGALDSILNSYGNVVAVSPELVVDKKAHTLSALSDELSDAFSGSGLPAIGIRKMQSEIMRFRNSCDQMPLDKRFEMALDSLFTTARGFDTKGFVKAMGKVHEIFAKYDYPMLFVKDKSRKFVPALHIELPESALAQGKKLADAVDRGADWLLSSAKA